MASLSTPDLCIIGAGSSGLAAAAAARRLGASVVVVEKGTPGGSRVRSGPLALRAIAAAGQMAALAARAPQLGVTIGDVDVSIRKVHGHIAATSLVAAAENNLARLQTMDVQVVRATGAFANPRTLIAGDVEIRAKKFIIATGGRPLLPEITGLVGVPYFTTDTIFDNTRQLRHLLIAGAGPMGLELALAYRRFGSEVTLVESGRILPHADPELAAFALRRLAEEGVVLHENANLVAVQSREESIGAALQLGTGESLTLDVSHLCVAGGRIANFDDLALEAGNIRRAKLDPRTLALSASLRTSNPRVYAIGEAAGHPPMPHLAEIEADLVVRAALLGQPVRLDPTSMPRVTFTDPELAEIGLTEPMARQRLKGGFAVLRVAYGENDKARALRAGPGVAKLIVSSSGRILGAGVAGPDAGEMIGLFALAMAAGLPVRNLATLAAAHPTYTEIARSLGQRATTDLPPLAPRRWQMSLKRLLP